MSSLLAAGVVRGVFRPLLRFARTDFLPEMGRHEEDVKLCNRIDVGTADTMLALPERHYYT